MKSVRDNRCKGVCTGLLSRCPAFFCSQPVSEMKTCCAKQLKVPKMIEFVPKMDDFVAKITEFSKIQKLLNSKKNQEFSEFLENQKNIKSRKNSGLFRYLSVSFSSSAFR